MDYDCECDPFTQNCPNLDDACYISLQLATTFCALPNSGNPSLPPPGVQDEPCEFINTCAEGYGCTLLVQENPPEFVCAFTCRPEGGEPSCATGATGAHECVRIRDFYSDTETVPPELGLCALLD